jgi:hypothetical protein
MTRKLNYKLIKLVLAFIAIVIGLYGIYDFLNNLSFRRIIPLSLERIICLSYFYLAAQIIVYCAIHGKQTFNTLKRNTLLEEIKSILHVSGLFLLFSFIFRVYGIWKIGHSSGILELLIKGTLSDLNTLRFFYPLFLSVFLYRVSTTLFINTTEINQGSYNLYTAFNVLNIFLLGFLWGWVPDVGRFVGLEILYIKDMSEVRFDYSFIGLSLFLACSYCFMCFKIRRKSSEKIIFLWTWILGVCGIPALLLAVFIIIGSIHSIFSHYYLLDDTNKKYVSKYNDYLDKSTLSENPIHFFYNNSVRDFLKILSSGTNKKMLPFFQRPYVEVSNSEKFKMVNLLLSKNESLFNIKFPAYRKAQKANAKHYNIVVIILESFEPKESKSFLGKENPIKFFEELKKDSLVLDQCFANAQASYEGEAAISSSLPIWGIINGKINGLFACSRTKSFLTLLKENGYYTYFSTTWDSKAPLLSPFQEQTLKFFSINTNKDIFYSKTDYYTHAFMIAGIQNISELFNEHLSPLSLDPRINDDDYEFAKQCEQEKGIQHGIWFIHDSYGYEKLYKKMLSLDGPFFIVTHTESSHTNFPVAKGFKPLGEISSSDRYYYGMKYADTALKDFFTKIKKHPVYKNTIFILISDHTSGGKTLSLYDQYHISALVHAPNIIKPRIVTKPTFQIDIGPTIVDLLNLSGNYTSFGTSWNSEMLPHRGMILPDWDGYLIFVYDPYILKVDTNKVYEFYDFRKNKEKDLIQDPSYKEIIDHTHKEFLKTYLFFADSLYSNRIMPAKE